MWKSKYRNIKTLLVKLVKSRKIINPTKLKFTPFTNYGKQISGMSWYKISYDQNTGAGSYILKMAPGTISLRHKHQNYEEFYVLEGELKVKIFNNGKKMIKHNLKSVYVRKKSRLLGT